MLGKRRLVSASSPSISLNMATPARLTPQPCGIYSLVLIHCPKPYSRLMRP